MRERIVVLVFIIAFLAAAHTGLVPAQTLNLEYSTYLGGGSGDYGQAIAIDSENRVYLTGYTYSDDFPTGNSYQASSSFTGDTDIFVSKISSSGSYLIYSTYIGGSGKDYGQAIAIDSENRVYLTGDTYSDDFPTENPYQASHSGGNDDAFVCWLSSSGSSLLYSTYLGGDSWDQGCGIFVESDTVYVTGVTDSTDFPTQNSFQAANHGGNDVFISRFSSTGSSLIYSTYLGGLADDIGYGIFVEAGSAYLTGYTHSSFFPTMNPYQTNPDTFPDAFVSKLSTSGSSLIYSTYLGGTSPDFGYGISVESGSAYVTGCTNSRNFPTLNPYQTVWGGNDDVFISRLASAGSSLIYSTYLGGSDKDQGHGISLGTDGTAYVAGYTASSDFPTENPYQAAYGGGTFDIFVSSLSSTGSVLSYSTYLGGSGSDRGEGISLGTDGAAYVTGYTDSSDFPTENSYQAGYGGGTYDAFVSKLSFIVPTATPAPSPSPTPENYVCNLTLDFSTYLGGDLGDYGRDIALNDFSDIFITGYTLSANFPTDNSYQPAHAGGTYNAFVSKVSSSGSYLVFSTYLGGLGMNYGYGIAVDSDNQVYVAGATNASDFPVENSYQSSKGGGNFDAFISKLASSGTSLIFSTYLGGAGEDYGYGVALNTLARAYMIGYTTSSDFPTRNAYQASQAGGNDVFVTKFHLNGSTLAFSTYLGGTDNDVGQGIVVDGTYLAYVAGYTESTDFPVENAYQSNNAGGTRDAFSTKFNFLGNNLIFSTYLGGISDEIAYDIALDGNRNAYITGRTSSSNFPTCNSYQATLNGVSDVFVVKLSTPGAGLVYATYIGGTLTERAYAIDVGSDNSAYVSGYSNSSDYPLENPFQSSRSGDFDLIVTRLSPPGTSLLYSTYLGGSLHDEGQGIAVNSDGSAYVTGYTKSTDFPTENPYQAALAGGDDAIVAKLSWVCHLTTPTPPPTPTATPTPIPTATPTATPSAPPPPSATPTNGGTRTPTPVVPTPTPTPSPGTQALPWIYDYNGDGTSDIAVFRAASGLWAIRDVTRVYFGETTDETVPGDYDGDGTTDVSIYRSGSGLWAIRGLTRVYFGGGSDIPEQGDYNGDGTWDVGIFRDTTGLWAIRAVTRIYFGTTDDLPVAGYYGGGATKEIAIFRGSSALWAIRSVSRIYFGADGDTVIPGDYEGSGSWAPGIFRDSTGLWAIRGLTRVYFGEASDQPVPADYVGNSRDDIGIFRDSSGLWAIRSISRVYFGTSGDIPVTR